MNDVESPMPGRTVRQRSQAQRLIALNALLAWARAQAEATPAAPEAPDGEIQRTSPTLASRGVPR